MVGARAPALVRWWTYERVGQERREGAVQDDARRHRHRPDHPPNVCHGVAVAVANRGDRDVRPPQRVGRRMDVGALRADLDRKSTRLNSSHGYISYAVFCLKKKRIKSEYE